MGLFKNLLGTVLDEFRIGRGNASNKYLYANVRDSDKPGLRWNNASEAWEFSNNGTSWTEMGSGGGGGYSLSAIVIGNNTYESSDFAAGGVGITGADLGSSTVKFVASGYVTNSGLTGTITLYNLTDLEVTASLTFTELVATTKKSTALTLPSGAKEYEVRIKVTGGTPPADLVQCLWAGIELS
jgi:hypothetical protein